MAEMDWEAEVLDAFKAGDRELDRVTAVSALIENERSAVLNVSRSAKEDRQVDLEALAKQFDRLLKKVIQDLKLTEGCSVESLKGYPEALESSFRCVSQAQQHMRKLFSLSVEESADEIPFELHGSQHGISQAMRNLFSSKFEQTVCSPLCAIDRHLQILLESSEAIQREKKRMETQGKGSYSLSALLGRNEDAEKQDVLPKVENFESLFKEELMDIQARTAVALPIALSALKEFQKEAHATALRYLHQGPQEDQDDGTSILSIQSFASRTYRKECIADDGLSYLSGDVGADRSEAEPQPVPKCHQDPPRRRWFRVNAQLVVGLIIGVGVGFVHRRSDDGGEEHSP